MKNIKEYITESYITEAVNEIKSIWASKIEAKQIQDKLKNFFKGYKGKVSLTNKSELGKFFKQFLGTLSFGTNMQNLRVLKDYGMATEQGFAAVILGNQKEFEENKWNTECIKNFDLSEIEKEYKKWKDSDEYVQGVKVDDTSEQDDIDDRILIVYDRWDPETAEEFDFKGKRGKSTEHIVNMCRVEFGKDTDTKYYDCYPILAKNYFGNLETIKKRAELGIMNQEIYQQI